MSRRLFVIVLASALNLGMLGFSTAQSPSDTASRVVEIEVPAPALASNLLGTSDVQNVAVYLPPSYDSDPVRPLSSHLPVARYL